MNNLNITYVFGSGRREKLLNKSFTAKEFFYGYQYFQNTNINLNIIEMLEEKPNVIGVKKLFRLIDKILRKISNLPFYFTEILSLNNFKIIKKTDKLIVTNDRLAISLLPFLLYCRIFNKTKIYIIVMGLFSKKIDNNLIKIFQTLFINILLTISTKIIFLGEGELNHASKKFSKFENKFKYLPFSIDFDFWGEEASEKIEKNYILFIGNDGNRDYKNLIKIAKILPEENFVFITKNITEDEVPSNCLLINGHWNNTILSDEEIRNYYRNAKLVILPIKNSYQPSGQSVALQSMAVGIPVVITKTEGFWDERSFEHCENIYFINSNTPEVWLKEVSYLLNNKKLMDRISMNAKKLISSQLSLEQFNTKLERILDIS